MKGQLLVTVAILLGFTASAWTMQRAGDADDLQTLSDYLRYAALNNAGLKVAFERWKAAIRGSAGLRPWARTRARRKSDTPAMSMALGQRVVHVWHDAQSHTVRLSATVSSPS